MSVKAMDREMALIRNIANMLIDMKIPAGTENLRDYERAKERWGVIHLSKLESYEQGIQHIANWIGI